MFDPAPGARVYAVPLGCDFSARFLDGLQHLLKDQPPEAMARVEIYVNTRRSERRLQSLLTQGKARFLPRIHLISDLGSDPQRGLNIPPAVPKLRRKLQLSILVAKLLEKQSDIAPQASVFDLTDSLMTLLDEMQWEGLDPSELENISSENQSEHWQRSLKFLQIAGHYTQAEKRKIDPEERQRKVIESLAQDWRSQPPQHPIIVAGSTGSRGSTTLFMQAVAGLPLGAVVLPGFDRDLPANVWTEMTADRARLDHPQSGFARLCKRLKIDPSRIPVWGSGYIAAPERNRLLSLALRPAPITDQWFTDGPALRTHLATACENIALIEAPSPKDEANAIALRLRQAVADGQKAALVTPDRFLSRRVAAALQRWDIFPDDSAGKPLSQTPPGILLRMVSDNFGQLLTPQNLISLLKHPLCHAGEGRGQHLLRSRDLELQLLRGGPPYVDFTALAVWASKRQTDPEAITWVAWLRGVFQPLETLQNGDLLWWTDIHRQTAEALAKGVDEACETGLWLKEAGIEAARVFCELEREADSGGTLSTAQYQALIRSVLNSGEVRESLTPHPEVAIWGTLEARVQWADLVILGGLNDGIWPKTPNPDPWLSRNMRKQINLPLPERQIGLSAHDFQQAAAAPHVVLSRAIRDGDAPTVASRWLIRLENLLGGLGQEGNAALIAMRNKGQNWLNIASQLDKPAIAIAKAKRPSPCPPLAARPKKLSVTKIKTLVRDPYAIYASEVLRLRPLESLGREPDYLARGIALHDVLESFISETEDGLPPDAVAHFLETATRVLERRAPWPTARRIWMARLARVADWFVQGEALRRESGFVVALERRGVLDLQVPEFRLTTTADRIDLDKSGGLRIFDYKSGTLPSPGEIKLFDKQLQLEAMIAQAGGFDDIAPAKVTHLEYIGLGGEGTSRIIDLGSENIDQTAEELGRLMTSYQRVEQGYTSRSKVQSLRFESDYDHVARFGEWEDNDIPIPVTVS